MIERAYKHQKDMTAEELRAIERAVMGAIGWVGSGINEGNIGVANEIIARLNIAARHYENAALQAGSDKAEGS